MVKTETKYTKKTIRDYAIFHFLRKSLSKTILSIIVIIHLLILLYFFECFICIGFHFSLVKVLASGLEINDLIDIIGFIIFLMILPSIYYFGIYKPLVSRLKRNYRIEKDMKIDYEFGENEVKLSLSTPFENDSFIYTYNSIDKIYETSKYFYIYFSKYDLFILSKENLANEDLSKLQSIFEENLNENKFVKR